MLREETYEDEKRIIALLLAVLLAVGLIGCKDVLKDIVHKTTGTSDEVQEEDTTRWADATADPLIIRGSQTPLPSLPRLRQTAACTPCSTASGAAAPTISLRRPAA